MMSPHAMDYAVVAALLLMLFSAIVFLRGIRSIDRQSRDVGIDDDCNQTHRHDDDHRYLWFL